MVDMDLLVIEVAKLLVESNIDFGYLRGALEIVYGYKSLDLLHSNVHHIWVR